MTVPDIRHTHDNNCDMFFYVARRWCLTHVKELLAADPSLATPFLAEIQGLDEILGITPPQPGHIRLLQVQIDKDKAMEADASELPLAVQFIAEPSGLDCGPVIIDGWPLLYKLRRQGFDQADMLMLAAEVEEAVRVPITLGPATHGVTIGN